MIIINKKPVYYNDNTYYVTVEENIYEKCNHYWHYRVMIFEKNKSKFKIFEYKKLEDENYNYEKSKDNLKELVQAVVVNYVETNKSNFTRKHQEKLKYESSLRELDDWDGFITHKFK